MIISTIKSRIVLAALIVTVPTFLLFLFGFWQDIEQRKANALDLAGARARLITTRLNDQIGDVENLVVGLSDAYEADWLIPANNDQRFHRIKSELPPYYTFIELIDAEGRDIGSASDIPRDHLLPRADEAQLFKRVSQSNGIDISDPVVGPITGSWTIRFTRGIKGADGTTMAALIVGVKLDEFDNIVATSGYPAESSVIAVNQRGRVLISRPNDTDAIGRNIGATEFVRNTGTRDRGDGVLAWLDGDQRSTGFARAADAPWLVFYGLPKDYATVDTRQIVVRGVGFSLAAIIIAMLAAGYMAERITRPLGQLTSDAASFGAGDMERRSEVSGPDEVGRLAAAFNATLDRLQIENKARRQAEYAALDTALKLEMSLGEVAERSKAIDLLGRMSHRLQSCLQLTEFGPIIERLVPRIISDMPGALYLVDTVSGRLDFCASWNIEDELPTDFGSEECWALRRGQAHIVEDDSVAEVACAHLGASPPHSYRCMPLVAQGNIIGVLYLISRMEAESALPTVDENILTALTENISLAVSNQKLRESLRNDSIVDILTGLFNRRYLEESLPLEFARAERGTGSVGVVMIDIDHFKHFNTDHGHDGGDAILRKIGSLLASQIRKGDIVCRFGGEEFILILPGADVAAATVRANAIRVAAKSISVTHRGMPLGSVTLSFGVASFPVHGSSSEEIVKAADDALLRAKANGRDRVEVAEMTVHEPQPGGGGSTKVVSLSLVQTDTDRRPS